MPGGGPSGPSAAPATPSGGEKGQTYTSGSEPHASGSGSERMSQSSRLGDQELQMKDSVSGEQSEQKK